MNPAQLNQLSSERLDQQHLARAFAKLPDRWHKPVADSYARTYRSKGRKAANLAVLDTLDSVQGFRFGVAAGEDELRSFAKARADECFRAAARWKDADAALLAMIEVAQRYGIKPPDGANVTKSGQRARLLDSQWWRRQARVVAGRNVEAAAIIVGLVHRRAGLYASDETVARRRGQKAKNRRLLETIKALNDLGHEFTLQELSDKGVSNPAIRRMELMTRLSGFDKIAVELGHEAEFYTLTAPSKYHARDSISGRENPNYQGATPRQVQKYLVKVWARARAALHRRGLNVYGFRVAEPHHDGCPHWHMVLFMEAGNVQQVREILKRYALAEDGDEKGAQRHRFTAKAIDRSKGNAAGYLAKYIAKNIDGHGVGEDWEAVAGDDGAAESAQRVDAWASAWGIRQFQQIGGASVTVWRELRRMDAAEAEPGLLRQIIEAADGGEWDKYNELNGGVMAKRAARPVAAWRFGPLDIETGELCINKYGELAGAAMKGILFEGAEILTRLRVWVFERSGAAAAPWSSVNNCTRESVKVLPELEKIEIPPACLLAKDYFNKPKWSVLPASFWKKANIDDDRGIDGYQREGRKTDRRSAAGDFRAGCIHVASAG